MPAKVFWYGKNTKRERERDNEDETRINSGVTDEEGFTHRVGISDEISSQIFQLQSSGLDTENWRVSSLCMCMTKYITILPLHEMAI